MANVLAFRKTDHSVKTGIAALGLPSDAYPNGDRGAIMAWLRHAGTSNTAAFVGYWGTTHTPGGVGIFASTIAPSVAGRFAAQYTQDGSEVYRTAQDIYAGGSIENEWHALYSGKSTPGEGYLRAQIDDQAAADTARGSDPNDDVPEYAALFFDGGAGGAGNDRFVAGQIARPLLFISGPSHDGDWASYYADRGKGQAAIYSAADLKAAPYPVLATAGEACRVYAVNAAGVIDPSVTVIGLPAHYAGVGEGWSGLKNVNSGDHYAYADWPTPAGTAGMTALVEVQVDVLPASGPAILIGRRALGVGGLRLGIETFSLSLRINSFNALGQQTMNLTGVSAGTLTLGTRAFIALAIAEDGATAQSIVVGADGTVHATNNHNIAGAQIVYNSDGFIAGRGRLSSSNFPWDHSYGTFYRAAMIPETLTAADVQAIAAGGALPAGSVDIAGFESTTIVDLADSIRGDGKRRLWGVIDFARTEANENYATDIPTTVDLGVTEIVVGS